MYTKQISDLKYEVIFESADELSKFNNFMNPPKTLKAGEVMKELDITRVTLCHYVKKGLLDVVADPASKQYRYSYDSVMRLKQQ